MTDESVGPLSERLKKLERAYRRWKIVGAMTVVLALTVIAGAAAPRSSPSSPVPTPIPRTAGELHAKRFVLVDDAGKVRAVLGAATGADVSLGLFDNEGKLRSVLMVDADGIPRLELLGTDEMRRVVLSVLKGRSGLALFGEAARGGAVFDVAADGAVTLGLIGDKERTRAGLLLRADGSALLDFNDGSGRMRAAFGVGNDGSPGLGLWDAEGRRIWQAPPAPRRP